MALWLNVNKRFRLSVASNVCKYIHENAAKNDSKSQECMVHWALCYSTMESVTELNSGVQFLKNFIRNIQFDQKIIGNGKHFNIELGPID